MTAVQIGRCGYPCACKAPRRAGNRATIVKAELLQFPHGQHDDRVDSVSQFLAWVQNHKDAISFHCDWIDPWPPIEELLGQSIPAAGEISTAPVLKPKVLIAVRGKDGTTHMSSEDLAEQIASAAREREQWLARSS